MKRALGGLLRWGWYLAAVVLVLCAALVTLGQYYFPYLGEHKDELLARVAEDLPFGVEVAGLGAEWTGLAPTLHVRGLRLFARDEPQVTILSSSRSELRIDMLRSLFSLAPRLRRIVADEVQLGFTEDADGRWHIAGVGGGRAPSNPEAILDFFLAIEEIDLRRTRLVLRAHEGGRVETEGAELAMENYRRFRRLHVTARDESPGGEFSLLLESYGDPRRRDEFSATAYLRLDKARLKRLQPLLPPALRMPDAALSGELWARLSEEGVVSLSGALRAPELDPRAFWPERTQLQPLNDIDLRFGAEWAGDRGSLWLDELRCQWFGQPLELERVRVDAGRGEGVNRIRAGAEYLDVGGLAGALQSSALLEGQWGEALAELSPYGGLVNAHLELSLPASGAPDFRFRAGMVDVSASPWRRAPGVRNARGYLEITPRGGFADIDSGATSLEFPHLYHDELEFDRIAGRVHWERDAGGLRVGSELLRAVTGGTGIDASFAIDFRKDPAADDTLSLAFGLRDADALAYRTYLPHTVSPAMREWLDASIEAGHVDSAAFTYHAVFSRPDRPFSYAMQLGLDWRDAAVSYHPDWPPVSGAAGRALIDERRVRVWAGSGRVLQSELRHATVEVLPRREERRLRVGVELGGDLADGLRVVNTSPLAKLTGGALRSWQASGDMALRLALDMPLGGRLTPQTSSLDLAADIEGGRLLITELRLPFDDVHGRLGFDLQRGLHSERLDGRLWGRPLRAAIGAAGGETERRIAIRVDGAAELPRVAEWLGWDLDEYLSGVAPLRVDIAQQPGHGFGFVLRSSLAGAASTLPAPLAKAADDTWPLELRWSPVAAGADLSLQLGTQLWALVHRDPQGSFSGEIALGAQPVAGGEDLRISGRLAQADAGAWIAAVQHLVAANATRGGGPRTVLRLAGLELESATLLGAELHALRVDSRWAERDFVLDFASDALSGEFRLPADPAARYALTLDRLQLRAFLGPVAATPVDGEGAGGASPARDEQAWHSLQDVRLPDTDVLVRHAALDDKDLGEWVFRIGSEVDALAMTDVRATLPGLRLGGMDKDRGGSFRLRWIAGEPRSELLVGARSDDIERFFAAWGYANVLEGRKGRADVDFSWPGNPAQFEMANVSGTLDFSWSDGRLLFERGDNPFMRTLGLMNFDEVLRRIRLDFKDLYQSGLAFDRFNGMIEVGEGFAHTREPITLEGPSARMKFSGRSDLRARTIDADLIVTLPIGSNLPWLAALAGGLPAAAGVYVASRIFEDQLGKFSSAIYTVRGKLDDPAVEFVKVFDTEDGQDDKRGAPAAGEPVPDAASPAADGPAAPPAPEQP
ncbi:MAG: TIGR02099 family protein [Pseudomonadales bacterium]|jgi:uncharacterized protein (TIGR02099 family)|nr:TIGR02099 family protein [Pseudomonadales bacterium]MBP9032690.1 TIGR02099 family protein [Pseudomonadales bacterium]